VTGFATSIEDTRQREFRRLLMVSGVAHLLLLLVFNLSPRQQGTALPAVVRVDLVAAGPAPAARAAVARPRPRPKPEKTVLPAEPIRAPKAKPKPEPKAKPEPKPEPKAKPKPEPVAEPQVEYDDLLAKLRREAGESAKPAQVAGAQGALAGAGRGVPVTPEVMAWMRKAKVHVTRAWVLAPGFRTQPLSTEVRVRLSAAGEVLGTRVVRRSGNPWYDESVERAIRKASPLPRPPEADDWLFVFRPQDVL
jgi:colicin import membrane protein